MSKAAEKPMSEYGEPWRHDTFVITNASGEVVEDGDQAQFTLEELNRIVACVNALAGIPNPESVRELIEAVREWTDVEKCETDERIFKALEALSAPSTGAQQE